MITVITVVAISIIVIVSFGLALWCQYKDGIFGHLGLVLMGGSGSLLLMSEWKGYDFSAQPLFVGMLMGMAIFLTRHALNALRFRKRKA